MTENGSSSFVLHNPGDKKNPERGDSPANDFGSCRGQVSFSFIANVARAAFKAAAFGGVSGGVSPPAGREAGNAAEKTSGGVTDSGLYDDCACVVNALAAGTSLR